jgi:hypothetical protein
MKLNLLFTCIVIAVSCHFTDGQGRLLKKSSKALKSSSTKASTKATKSPKASPSVFPTTCADDESFEDVIGRTCAFEDGSRLCGRQHSKQERSGTS